MRKTLLICLLAATTIAASQEVQPKAKPTTPEAKPPAAATTAPPPIDPLTGHNKGLYTGARTLILLAAEITPEEHYSFKPVESVRSFGQIVGHVADAQYLFCSGAQGEKNPSTVKIESSKTAKADLIAALKDAFAYCDKAYAGMTDASGSQMIRSMGSDNPRLGVLTVNIVHSIEHYGNMVTYMRMKNLVPPSSDPEVMKSLRKK